MYRQGGQNWQYRVKAAAEKVLGREGGSCGKKGSGFDGWTGNHESLKAGPRRAESGFKGEKKRGTTTRKNNESLEGLPYLSTRNRGKPTKDSKYLTGCCTTFED